MAKSKEVFVCRNCGMAAPKWQGQCAGCGEWNTLLAELVAFCPTKSRRPCLPGIIQAHVRGIQVTMRVDAQPQCAGQVVCQRA